MEGVSSIPSIFLNMSFGQFIDNFGIEKLRGMVSFSYITKLQAERITDYLKRYKCVGIEREIFCKNTCW